MPVLHNHTVKDTNGVINREWILRVGAIPGKTRFIGFSGHKDPHIHGRQVLEQALNVAG